MNGPQSRIILPLLCLNSDTYLKTKKSYGREKNGQMEIVVRLVRYCMSFFILTKYEFLEISDKVKQAPSKDVLMYFLYFSTCQLRREEI